MGDDGSDSGAPSSCCSCSWSGLDDERRGSGRYSRMASRVWCDLTTMLGTGTKTEQLTSYGTTSSDTYKQRSVSKHDNTSGQRLNRVFICL